MTSSLHHLRGKEVLLGTEGVTKVGERDRQWMTVQNNLLDWWVMLKIAVMVSEMLETMYREE
jgi:hypothetical protein